MSYPFVHRRQFVISRQRAREADGWLYMPLQEGFGLSYEPHAKVHREADVITIGTKIGTGRAAAGRFVTIDWPYIYPDNTGLLAVYFNSETISSSQALLGGDKFPPIAPKGMNWDPTSRSPSITRLTRRNRLHIPSHTTEWIDSSPRPLPSYEVARDTLASALQESARALSQQGKLYLALSGGRDSRTLLAALLAADVPFDTFTQIVPGMEDYDLTGSARLSRYFGKKHHIIKPNGHHPDKVERWKEHSFEGANEADNKHLLPNDQYRLFREGDILVRGSFFEVGRRRARRTLAGLDHTCSGAEIVNRMKTAAPHVAAELDKWLTERREHSDGLDLVDGFYVEQRAAWLCAVEQGMDSYPLTSIHPANSKLVFDALLTPEVEDREVARLQNDVLRTLEPATLKFPMNGYTSTEKLLRRTRARVSRLVRTLAKPAPPS